MATFEVYRDSRGDWRWRLRNDTGYIAVSGDLYASRDGALAGVEQVRTEVPLARVVDLAGE